MKHLKDKCPRCDCLKSKKSLLCRECYKIGGGDWGSAYSRSVRSGIEPIKDRMLRQIVKRDGHWIWTGPIRGKQGYGAITIKRKSFCAHRVMYETFIGPIPDGLQIDHICRVRNCVNPEHLEPVTCRENILRGEGVCAKNAKKTHCPKGHLYSETNTLYTREGGRQCRTCNVERTRQWRRFRFLANFSV